MKENLVENHWNEFLHNPLNVVDRLYNQMGGEITVEEFHNLIKEQLDSLLKSDPSKLDEIPYLNNRNLKYDDIRNKSLVRYRCMIQDMFNSEIYAAILNSQSNGQKINLYTDSIYFDDKYFVNPTKNTIMDRYVYYMVSIPGVNEWVKEQWDREGKTENISYQSTSQQQTAEHTDLKKRNLDDEDANETDHADKMETSEDSSLNSSIKKKKLDNLKDDKTANSTVFSKKRNYCTPIVEEENINKPVIVKIYDQKEQELKLNDLIELIGIIEFPNFENRTAQSSSADKYPEISTMFDNLDLDHEDYVYSELPRVHALNFKQLNSINPFNRFSSDNCKEGNSTYNKLFSLLEKMFFGDKLATEYFICWLVSRVYKVQDSLPIGNFPLNISNLKAIPNDEHARYVQKFYSVLECLCTHSLNLAMSIDELNNRILNPYKEKDNNKLQSGLLQLPTNFNLLLNETALQSGKLGEKGVKNLGTIKDMITWQSIEYDHLFYTQRINSDINVIVLSEGKSLLEVNCVVNLKPVESYTNVEEQFNLIDLCLNENLKEEFRNYLNYVRSLNCEIPADLRNNIQNDFVEMRKNKDGPKVCADDLHQFLSLSRLLAISEASKVLNDRHWEKAKQMELERRKRLQKEF